MLKIDKDSFLFYSLREFIEQLALRIICILGIFVSSLMYKENQTFFLVIIIVLGIVLIFSGEENIAITNDKVSVYRSSIAWVILHVNEQKVSLDEIDKIECSFQKNPGLAQTVGAVIVGSLLRFRGGIGRPICYITVHKKTGEMEEIKTGFSKGEMESLVKGVGRFLKQKKVLIELIDHMN